MVSQVLYLYSSHQSLNDIVQKYPAIAATITSLHELCIRNSGHVPVSVPPFPSKRLSLMAQLCHGAPGMLCLLACAKENARFFADYRTTTWHEAIVLATKVVWEQGLLSKGGGLCHGIAGNALPPLLLADPLSEDDLRLMSKGVAMLLEA
jgi:hypothetical protein